MALSDKARGNVERQGDPLIDTAGASSGGAWRPKSALVRDLLKFAVPDSRLPADFGSQLDHYLYGAPKRDSKGNKMPAGPLKARAGAARKKAKSKRRGAR